MRLNMCCVLAFKNIRGQLILLNFSFKKVIFYKSAYNLLVLKKIMFLKKEKRYDDRVNTI